LQAAKVSALLLPVPIADKAFASSPLAFTFMKSLLSWLVVCLCLLPAVRGGTDWKAGFASVKITPEKPVLMYGYANRVKPFERVAQDIYAKALVLEDEQGRRAVIVTTDLGAMPGSFADPLAQRITEKTGLQREQILLSWAHNHAGPNLSLKVTPGAGISVADAENRVTYTRWLQDRLVELVVAANARLEPATLWHGQGVANFVMNRREFTPRGVILGVNPRGPVDRSVPVLRVDGADGKPRAVLFGAACHNTTLGSRNYDLCGDYAGYAQHFLQEKFPGLQAMFIMGCGGDANPYPREGMENTRQHGAELAGEVARVLAAKLRPVAGPLKISFGTVDLPLQTPTREDLKPLAEKSSGVQADSARKMLATLERGEKLQTHCPAPVAVWQFGGDLTLVALPSEVVVDYVPLIEQRIGPLNLWVAAYCNEGFGYVPSARVLSEGGYETRGLISGDGWFAPQAQDSLAAKVAELATHVGRP
jgi:neutral ceramidase